MWLEPNRFAGKMGEPVELRLLVGDHGRVQDERPLGLDRAWRFQLYDDGKVTNLGSDVRYPDGVGTVVMERLPAYIAFDSEKFNEYAAEEGHRDRAPAGSRVRERYTRHMKTIVSGSDARDDDFKRTAGMVLELIPLDDPRMVRAGDSFALLALFEGKPLRGARLVVYANGVEQVLRTNRRGRATFRLDRPGPILIRTTLLRPCRCDDADYESFWAALTFETRQISMIPLPFAPSSSNATMRLKSRGRRSARARRNHSR